MGRKTEKELLEIIRAQSLRIQELEEADDAHTRLERKYRESENRLSSSEATLKSILLAAPIGIGLVHRRVFSWVNDLLTVMLGYPAEELIGRSARMLYPTEEEYLRVGEVKYDAIMKNGIGTVETQWVTRNGSTLDIMLSSSPLDRATLDRGVIFTAADITERKQAGRLIEASLKEKDILLKEVHHRVKNNMQSIISMLRLQSSACESKEVEAFSKKAIERIRSMALIHEKLIHSKDLAMIDVKSYVEELTRGLMTAYCNPECSVELQLEIDNEHISLDTATPCGLIIHELVSNALRHAFHGTTEGHIMISFTCLPAHTYRLIVKDNGTGITGAGSARGFGLQLVATLVEQQLDGTFEYSVDKGTTFNLLLKGNRYHQASMP
jgi:PAS domain S-box-containing protein